MVDERRWVQMSDPAYFVSDRGEVVSMKREKKGKLLKGCINAQGSRMSTLSIHGVRTPVNFAYLVADHFVEGKTKNKRFVHHIDGNLANNHFSNLKWVSLYGLRQHGKLTRETSTGVIGVHYVKSRDKYFARIRSKKKPIYLGNFDTLREAQIAYLRAKLKYHENVHPKFKRQLAKLEKESKQITSETNK